MNVPIIDSARGRVLPLVLLLVLLFVLVLVGVVKPEQASGQEPSPHTRWHLLLSTPRPRCLIFVTFTTSKGK